MFWKTKKPSVIQKGPALSCVHTGYCSKGACPLWVGFNSTVMIEGKKKDIAEAKCSLAWTPQLLIEMRDHLVLAVKNTDKQ